MQMVMVKGGKARSGIRQKGWEVPGRDDSVPWGRELSRDFTEVG